MADNREHMVKIKAGEFTGSPPAYAREGLTPCSEDAPPEGEEGGRPQRDLGGGGAGPGRDSARSRSIGCFRDEPSAGVNGAEGSSQRSARRTPLRSKHPGLTFGTSLSLTRDKPFFRGSSAARPLELNHTPCLHCRVTSVCPHLPSHSLLEASPRVTLSQESKVSTPRSEPSRTPGVRTPRAGVCSFAGSCSGGKAATFRLLTSSGRSRPRGQLPSKKTAMDQQAAAKRGAGQGQSLTEWTGRSVEPG